MPDPEVDPNRTRNAPEPEVTFLYNRVAELERLAWQDSNCQYFLHNDTDIRPPFSAIYCTVDGSSAPNGNFGFTTNLILKKPGDKEVKEALRKLAEQGDAVVSPDREYEYFFATESGFWYQVSLGDDQDDICIQTLASAGVDDDLALESRSLRHGVDAFDDSFTDFLDFSETLIEDLYAGLGLTEEKIDLLCTPLDIGNSRAEELATEHPEVTLSDVVGMDDVISQVRDIIDEIRHPEVFARLKMPRRNGILLHGPHGTGKTTIVKAIANEIGAKLRVIDCTDILSKWLGTMEKQLGKIFDDAIATKVPLILFFDELDGIVSSTEDHGSSERATALLKKRIETVSEANPLVIVAATTNCKDKLAPALIRAGRFDFKIHVPLPGQEGRGKIFAYYAGRYFDHEPPLFDLINLDLRELAEATEGFSGMDIEAVVQGVVVARGLHGIRNKALPAKTSLKPADTDEILFAIRTYNRERD